MLASAKHREPGRTPLPWMTDRAAMTTGCPQFGWVRILRRGVSHSPFVSPNVFLRGISLPLGKVNWRMTCAGMGNTSWVQLCEIDEVCEQPAHPLPQ